MSRKTVREALVTIFTGIGFTVVNGFAPTELNGATKVLNIYSEASNFKRLSSSLKDNFYSFNLDVLVKRSGVVADEDNLDTLHDALVTAVIANPSGASYNELTMEEDSVALFAEIAGIPYRGERHRVLVKVSS